MVDETASGLDRRTKSHENLNSESLGEDVISQRRAGPMGQILGGKQSFEKIEMFHNICFTLKGIGAARRSRSSSKKEANK